MTLVVEYLYWQFMLAPRWLAVLLWNMQRYLWRFFSVPFMLRTLFAPWRKDSVAKSGSLDQILMSYVWNSISRAIGAIVRSLVLTAYVIIACVTLVCSGIAYALFLLWPLLIVLSALASVALLVGSRG